MRDEATFRVKTGLAEMLKGGVIMDVVTPEQATDRRGGRRRRGDGARARARRHPPRRRRRADVRPGDDRRHPGGGHDPGDGQGADRALHGGAACCEALEVDYVDESEVLTPADEANHIDKWAFKVPFVCGATNLGEALRRIGEGAAMIRSKGEAGTGDIVEAVRHMRAITGEIRRLATLDEAELATAAKELGAPLELVRGGRRRRAPAGRAVLRRRHRHARRRGADDGARRRGRVRRLGHLQVRGPARARARDRRGDDALAGPRARRRGLARPRRRRWSAWRAPSSRTSSCWPSAAGSGVRWLRTAAARSACSRCRAASRRTSGAARGSGAGVARGARVPGRPRRARRARDPGRRVDDDDARDRARGAAPSRCASWRAAGVPGARLVRRADHARPRPPRR